MKRKSAVQHDLYTRWGEKLDKNCPLNEYPRPQMKRDNWLCLNGIWQYAIRNTGRPEPDTYDGEIVVPFSPESLLSGVKRQLLPGQTLWYKRNVTFESAGEGHRLLLHFGAVDQHCIVYINGVNAGTHSGGYWPFCFDITELVRSGENILTVAVTDDSDKGLEAYGKQKLKRGGIWYTAQSGIWQTIWAEYVPQSYISYIKITPRCREAEAEFHIEFAGEGIPQKYRIEIFEDGKHYSEGTFTENSVHLSMKSFRYWSPECPFLYTVKISAGQDSVQSYFGMREFGMVTDEEGNIRFALNGKPYFQSGLLDQGYWSDGLYTAPDDEAMVWEISELKKLGFNMLRKHIKIEPMRWYYHCDRLGMIVWQDFVSGGGPYNPVVNLAVGLPYFNIDIKDSRYGPFGRKNAAGRGIYERDLERTLRLLNSVVSIAVWVPFNEGWGQFDACRITGITRKLDGTRLIDHASGWHDQDCGDFKSRHVYFKAFKMRRDKKERIQALSEFGGYSCPVKGHMASDVLFGYRMYRNEEKLSAAYDALFRREVLPAAQKGLSASIYTQVSDVEDEINGVFTYDRAVTKLNGNTAGRINTELKESLHKGSN